MTEDPGQQAADHHYAELAAAHQQMHDAFPAYREMVQWLNDKISGINRGWQNLKPEDLQKKQGEKLGLEAVRSYIHGFLTFNRETQ